MQGFIKIHRQILNNPISTKPNYLAVWFYILANACHKDTPYILNNKKITVPRGSFYGSMQKIAQHFGISVGAVHKIINYFEADKMVNTKRTRNYTLFQVVNYDKFQDREHSVNTERTQREHGVKQKKNDKNVKNDKNSTPPTPQGDLLGDLPDCINPDIWSEWVEHRKQIKAKLTPLAAKRQVASLVEWYSQGHNPNDIISQSIANGWRGLFLPKPNQQKERKTHEQSIFEQGNALLERLREGTLD